MDRVFKKRSGRLFAALLSTALLAACSNNPFNPAAEPRIVSIRASQVYNSLPIGYSGIVQSGTRDIFRGDRILSISYAYADPVVTVSNRQELPPIDFSYFTVDVILSDGSVLPTKRYPINLSMLQGESTASEIDIPLPILSANEDLLNVVYPGNNVPRVRDGRAKVKIYGKDLNSHESQVELEIPLMFISTVLNSDGLADIPQEEAPQQGQNTNVQSPTNSGGQ